MGSGSLKLYKWGKKKAPKMSAFFQNQESAQPINALLILSCFIVHTRSP